MKLFYLLLVCYLLIIGVAGCAQDVIFDDHPSHDLYFSAELSDQSGLVIHVSSVVSLEIANTQSPTWIEDMDIHLFEDNLIVDTLEYIGDGFYNSRPNFHPNPGKTYHFEASHPDFMSVISNKVVMLDDPNTQNITIDTFKNGYRLKADILSGVEDEHYFIESDLVLDDSSSSFLLTQNLTLYTDFDISTGCGWDNTIITNYCHRDGVIPLDLYLEKQKELNGSPTQLVITFTAINKEYFEGLRVVNYPTAGIDAFFIGINIEINSFEKGIGVFYMKNSKEYIFPL